MYNKLFTKILDSSIWLEDTPTRLVWITLLAAMDEEGFAQFASVANLAHRARVTLEEANKAIECLQSPDENSSDPDNDGRRVERVPGGWMVLNAPKYRETVSRSEIKEKNRERVARHREKKRAVTLPKRPVTPCNVLVMQSEAETEAETNTEAEAGRKTKAPSPSGFDEFWEAYPKKIGRGTAESAWKRHKCFPLLPQILTSIRASKASDAWTKDGGQYIPYPTTWLNRRGWEDQLGLGVAHIETASPNKRIPSAAEQIRAYTS